MKVEILCHHLTLDDAVLRQGSIVDLDDDHAKNILTADELSGRSPRIALVDAPAKKVRKKRASKKSVAQKPLFENDVPSFLADKPNED